MHETFIELVKERRGGKLADNPDLFTGQFWTGKASFELGLVDEIGDMRSFLQQRYGEKTQLRLISPPRGLFGRKLSLFGSGGDEMPAQAAAGLVKGFAEELEERALWARFGL